MLQRFTDRLRSALAALSPTQQRVREAAFLAYHQRKHALQQQTQRRIAAPRRPHFVEHFL